MFTKSFSSVWFTLAFVFLAVSIVIGPTSEFCVGDGTPVGTCVTSFCNAGSTCPSDTPTEDPPGHFECNGINDCEQSNGNCTDCNCKAIDGGGGNHDCSCEL